MTIKKYGSNLKGKRNNLQIEIYEIKNNLQIEIIFSNYKIIIKWRETKSEW